MPLLNLFSFRCAPPQHMLFVKEMATDMNDSLAYQYFCCYNSTFSSKVAKVNLRFASGTVKTFGQPMPGVSYILHHNTESESQTYE